jgi:hypothetical protein
LYRDIKRRTNILFETHFSKCCDKMDKIFPHTTDIIYKYAPIYVLSILYMYCTDNIFRIEDAVVYHRQHLRNDKQGRSIMKHCSWCRNCISSSISISCSKWFVFTLPVFSQHLCSFPVRLLCFNSTLAILFFWLVVLCWYEGMGSP